MMMAVTSFAQSGKSIYNKYSDSEGISAVYISPAMFRMMGTIPSMDIDGYDVEIGSIVQSLTGMYILNSENKKINDALKADVEKFISKGKYELLMEAKDNGDIVRIYTMGDEKTVTGFVLLANEPGECSFICIDGSMSRKELERIISENMK